jgi:uncharacterized protein
MVHASPDGGVALTLLGPLTATVPLPGGGGAALNVTVTVDTEYPFGDDLAVTVAGAPAGMPVYLRVPAWAPAAPGALDGGPPVAVGGANGSFWRVVLPSAGTHTLAYALNPAIVVDSTAVGWNGAVAVHRGALTFALHLDQHINVTGSTPVPDPAHPAVDDFSVNTTAAWNVALVFDPADPAGPGKYFTFSRAGGGVNATQPFDHSAPALTIAANARVVPGWGTDLGSAAPPPASPACTAPGACGPVVPVTLVPFGATFLRMSVLPWTPQ